MSSPRRTSAAATAVLVAALTLTGCATAEEAVSGAVDGAVDRAVDGTACSLAREAVGGVEAQVREAADRLGADPRAARRELTALRDTLAAAERGLSGQTRNQVARARAAVDRLVAAAREAADGTVDERAVAQARRRLGDAVRGVQETC